MISDKPTNIGISTLANKATDKPVAIGASAPTKKEGSGANDNQTKAVTDSKSGVIVEAKEANKNETENKTLTAQNLEDALRQDVKEKVSQAIPKVRELMQKNQRSLDFRVAEEENRIIITVIDKETDKVIRQIPPEDLLEMAESLEQGLTSVNAGVIFDSKA